MTEVTAERKELERSWYEKRYGARVGLDSEMVRRSLLSSSEDYFFARMIALAGSEKRILEIGCGEGRHALACAATGSRVSGLDISEQAIAIARTESAKRGLENLTEFRTGDVEQLPYQNESFDVVINHEVLSSVLLEPVVKECRRVLRPGGTFLGIECLGHNPIFNLNRSLKAWRGERTRWAVEHILTEEGLSVIRENYSATYVRYFHVMTAIFGAPALLLPDLLGKKWIEILEVFDQGLFNIRPLRQLAFKVVFEAQV